MTGPGDLLAAVAERLARYADSGDIEALVDDRAEVEASELLSWAINNADDSMLASLQTTAAFYWQRFLARSGLDSADALSRLDIRVITAADEASWGVERGGPKLALSAGTMQATADLVAAMNVYALLLDSSPSVVPAELVVLASTHRDAFRFAVDRQLDRVTAMLERFDQDGATVSAPVEDALAALTRGTADLGTFALGPELTSRYALVGLDAGVCLHGATGDTGHFEEVLDGVASGLADGVFVKSHRLRAAELIVRAIMQDQSGQAPTQAWHRAHHAALTVFTTVVERGHEDAAQPRQRAAIALALLALHDAEQSGELDLLDERVAALTAAWKPDERAEGVAHLLASRAACCAQRHAKTGSEVDARAAHFLWQASIANTPSGAREVVIRLLGLLDSVADVSADGAEYAAVVQATLRVRGAIVALPIDDPGNREARLTLASLLDLVHYAELGDVDALHEAVQIWRAVVVELRAAEDPRLPDVGHALARALVSVYDETDNIDAAAEAFALEAEFLHRAPRKERVKWLVRYATTAMTLADASGELEHVSGLISMIERELEAGPPDPVRGDLLASLGRCCWIVHYKRGDPAALRRGIAALEEALTVGTSSLTRSAVLSLFGRMCVAAEPGDPRLIARAIKVARDAVEAEKPRSPGRAGLLSDLAMVLLARHAHTGDSGAVDEAWDVQAAAVKATRSGSLMQLHALTVLLAMADPDLERPERQQAWEALLMWQMRLAFESRASLAHRAGYLARVSRNILRLEAQFGGSRPELIEQAIDIARAGLAASFPRDRGQLVVALLTAFAVRATRSGKPADTTVALDAARAVLATEDLEVDDRAAVLDIQGRLLAGEHHRTGKLELRREVYAALRERALLPGRPPHRRLDAAADWADAAAYFDDAREELEAGSRAVALLEIVAWAGLSDGGQHRLLHRYAGFGAEIASRALEREEPERAVELLEQGRMVILGRVAAGRATYDALRSEHPEVAERYRAIRRRLEALDDERTQALQVSTSGRAHGNTADLRAQLTNMHDDLVVGIRRLPGWAGAFRPYTFAELAVAAGDDPVVILTATQRRSDALIVALGGVRVVPLPAATPEFLREHTARYLAATEVLANPGARVVSPAQALELRGWIVAGLSWLWDAACGPVLGALGLRPAKSGDLPRLTWCPTGNLAMLPLHAAGKNGISVLDCVVSSYTPTLRSLLSDAGGAAEVRSPRQPLMVAASAPPERMPLRSVAADVAAFRRRFPRGTILQNEAATAAAVQSAVAECDWLQVSCHADLDHGDPSRSGLALADRVLTVRELRRQESDNAAVAIVLACETARPAGQLVEESMTLAAVLQAAGFAQVVGTMGSVDDGDASFVANAVLRRLGEAKPHGGLDLARAVHDAVSALRLRFPHAPMRWVGFVHVGR